MKYDVSHFFSKPHQIELVSMLTVAYKMLVNSKKKLFGMLVSATFSAFIVMQQPSIYQGVADRLVAQIQSIKGVDLWVMSRESSTPDQPTHFKPIDLYRIRSVPGVQSAIQLHKSWMWMEHEKTKTTLVWDVIGVDSESMLGMPQNMLVGIQAAVRYPNSIIVDGYAQKQLAGLSVGDKMREGGRTWIVRGITHPLRTYAYQPKLFMLSKHMPTEFAQNSFILVKVKPNFNVSKVAYDIRHRTHYDALTPSQFSTKTLVFFRKSTPIIIMFIAVAVGGFLIGLIIMWQIFSNFILTHLHQFGMLKMLGATNAILTKMVLSQAAFIGGIAYLVGLLLLGIFGIVLHDTDVACHLTWSIALLGLLGTGLMILFSSYLSISKVLNLDTVDLCREQN